MRSKFFTTLAILGSALLVSTACTKKEVKPEDTGANAGGANSETSPVVQDKPISQDSQGSDGGKIPGLSTVFFEFDQARLTSDARKRLAENAEWIKGHAGYTVQVEGHTDEKGSVEYNLALGERRAKSVKAYLESLGVDGKRLTIISYGEEKPLVSGSDESAYSKNRRANFVPLQ